MSLTSHPLLNSLKEMLGIIQIALNVLQTTSKRQGWAPSPRDAAGTGPAVFKTTLLRKTLYLQSSLVKCCIGYFFI